MSSSLGGQVDVDPNDPHVQEIGEWAVKEYNRESRNSLKFLKVLRGKQQVVSGMMYNLVLLADDGSNNHREYEAKVWEQPWLVPPRKLESFDPLLLKG